MDGAGGSVLDSLVQVMIQTAGYPAEEVACLAVPFWQAYSASVSQNQVCTVHLISVHVGSTECT